MNPDENQENYWQDNQQAADQPSDYPQETYQPADQEVDAPVAAAETRRPVETPEEVPVQWVAHEYIHEEKGTGWYIIIAVVVLLLIAADVLFLKSFLWTFSFLVMVMAVALVVYSRRPPRDIQYALSGKQGLYIGERLYHLSDFKAFGLIKDGDHNSIMLIPVKRFAPGVSVYFPDEAGERIVDILGQRLPMETLKLDAIDILVRKLRL